MFAYLHNQREQITSTFEKVYIGLLVQYGLWLRAYLKEHLIRLNIISGVQHSLLIVLVLARECIPLFHPLLPHVCVSQIKISYILSSIIRISFLNQFGRE